jgi:hypothetical protein
MAEITYTQVKQRAKELYEAQQPRPKVAWDKVPHHERNPWMDAAKNVLGVVPEPRLPGTP